MSLGSFAGEVGKGVLGMNKKAMLIIYKGSSGKVSSEKALNSTKSVLDSADSSATMRGLTDELPNHHILRVQFNPASVRLEANINPVPTKWLEDNFDSSITNQQERNASIVMYVDLIFDAVSNKDAFHGDKFRLSLSDAAAAAGTGIKQLAGGYSVLKQTNGLIAAMTNESTRVISFLWADMKFTGILEQIQARYTMFSPSGRPIRSTVTLGIHQSLDREEVGQWEIAFNNFFGNKEKSSDLISGKSRLQEMQKLINIRL
jgi:hypothetical protein